MNAPWNRVLVAALLGLSACPSVVDDDPSATDGADGCPNPAFTCTPECRGDECGPLLPFDESGCLRLPCTTDDDCPSGELCYRPTAFGVCDILNTIECSPIGGQCACTISSGPASYCVAEDDRPTKLANDCACGCECGDPGSNSHVDDAVCTCDAGFTWCDPNDPDDYACCPI